MEAPGPNSHPHGLPFPSPASTAHSDGSQPHTAVVGRPPRVGHKKSRNGCAQCKRRHVKCNEAVPCANCVRHGVACSLAGGPYVRRDDAKDRRPPPQHQQQQPQHQQSQSTHNAPQSQQQAPSLVRTDSHSSHPSYSSTAEATPPVATPLLQHQQSLPAYQPPPPIHQTNHQLHQSLPSNIPTYPTTHIQQQPLPAPSHPILPPPTPSKPIHQQMQPPPLQQSQVQSNGTASTIPRASVPQAGLPHTPPQDSPAAQTYRQTSPFTILTDIIGRPGRELDVHKAWSMDLQLIHHWMTHTADLLTMPNIEPDLPTWQHHAPLMAFEHEYMLHGILGTAALHKAHLKPEEAPLLKTVAVKHMDKSLALNRMDVSPTTARNANARFLFTWNILVMAYAVPNHNRPLDAIVELMGLARGVDAMLAETWLWVSQGPFAHTLTSGYGKDGAGPPPHLPDMSSGLKQLDRMMNVEPMIPDDVRVLDLAIADLKAVYESAVSLGAHTTFSSMICWPKQEPSGFFGLLSRRLSQAYIVMAFYCVLLDLMDNKWWLYGWGRRVLQDIMEILPQRWHHWIDGPVQSLLVKNSPVPTKTEWTGKK